MAVDVVAVAAVAADRPLTVTSESSAVVVLVAVVASAVVAASVALPPAVLASVVVTADPPLPPTTVVVVVATVAVVVTAVATATLAAQVASLPGGKQHASEATFFIGAFPCFGLRFFTHLCFHYMRSFATSHLHFPGQSRRVHDRVDSDFIPDLSRVGMLRSRPSHQSQASQRLYWFSARPWNPS